ncbi:hypothetical protein V6N12_017839, partial [Hibiscus sabdariffa]
KKAEPPIPGMATLSFNYSDPQQLITGFINPVPPKDLTAGSQFDHYTRKPVLLMVCMCKPNILDVHSSAKRPILEFSSLWPHTFFFHTGFVFIHEP